MSAPNSVLRLFVATAAALALFPLNLCRADDLRNVKRGEPVPAYSMPSIEGSLIESQALKGSVVVIVCLSAEQRRSELAAMDSTAAVHASEGEPVKLVFVTADVIQKPYFERFRRERSITAPLAFDSDRALFGKLGLIVFPTTLVVDKEGRLAQVISLHNAGYRNQLEAYIQHTLGTIDDKQLAERLTARSSDEGTPKSLASAHRALARSLRQKGQLKEAQKELASALEQDPDNREILLDIADLDLTMNNLDEADAMVDKVLAAQPENRRARQVKGIVLFERGDIDGARAVLEESLSLNPNPEVAHYYLGLICEKKGDQAAALQHYREALRRFIHQPAAPDDAGHGAK